MPDDDGWLQRCRNLGRSLLHVRRVPAGQGDRSLSRFEEWLAGLTNLLDERNGKDDDA
ncbi:MAG: hypothetical protein Q7T86_04665 [Hyphomicrobiaceae bacterium]|nr:hypothetical protein [Hyphomicrobiaceae bacterium]